MARNLQFLVLLSVSALFICETASIFSPVSDSHRSAALNLFSPTDGSFESLEETYWALRTFEVLGIEKPEIKASACAAVVNAVSSTLPLKDLYDVLRVNGILKCDLNGEAFRASASRLKDSLDVANTILDYYYSIGGLFLLKEQTSEVDFSLEDAGKIFRSIESLIQVTGNGTLVPAILSPVLMPLVNNLL